MKSPTQILRPEKAQAQAQVSEVNQYYYNGLERWVEIY